MKKLCLVLLLLSSSQTFPQTAEVSRPDYDEIKKNIKDKSSPYHFDRLFERYTKADSTLTIEDKRHLYYGYSFRKEYSPYERSDAEGQLNKLLQKEKASLDDLEKVIAYTDEILKQYPFSLRIKEYRIYCFKELERFDEAHKEMVQASAIIDAILSTGDGTTKESCLYVINTVNEYEMLHILGFEYGGSQSLVEHRYDYLALNENSYNVKGLYFDVSRCLDSMKF